MVIISGLFHGLIFLPVVLSLFGPDPYPFVYGREEDEFDSNKKESPVLPKFVEMKPLQETVDFIRKDGYIPTTEEQPPSLPNVSINVPLLAIGGSGCDDNQRGPCQAARIWRPLPGAHAPSGAGKIKVQARTEGKRTARAAEQRV